MAYPDIHTCMRLTSENEELRMKLVKVKHQRDDAVSELRQLKEANKVHELLRNYVTTRDIYVQTEGRLSYPPLNRPAKKTGEENEEKKSSTLLSMHSSLMKRYEKEVKQNMTHIETITNLNLGMIELERKLKERTEEVTKLEREVKMLQIQSKSHARRRDTNRGRSPDMSGDEDDVSKIRKENRKLRKDLDRLKQEISVACSPYWTRSHVMFLYVVACSPYRTRSHVMFLYVGACSPYRTRSHVMFLYVVACSPYRTRSHVMFLYVVACSPYWTRSNVMFLYGFFEEIEDIKFALQQSAKLNKVYEKTLRKLCMQFGVPYPNPELAIQGHS
ncbi:hypothetical protein MAR_010555 [Mya arenaria]|uniref:Uncharacterized protein n=1 Tax=Mya arenaria TaxID=6604 RepID=A0ABY7E1W8_MYAAR|nr:hypothetical protein MAR_010555 [Mya arenaria]